MRDFYSRKGPTVSGPEWDKAVDDSKYNRHRSIAADEAFAEDCRGKITQEMIDEAAGTYGGWKRLTYILAKQFHELTAKPVEAATPETDEAANVCRNCGKLKDIHRNGFCFPDTFPQSSLGFTPLTPPVAAREGTHEGNDTQR